MALPEKPCAWCGKLFTPSRRDTTCCSQKCVGRKRLQLVEMRKMQICPFEMGLIKDFDRFGANIFCPCETTAELWVG